MSNEITNFKQNFDLAIFENGEVSLPLNTDKETIFATQDQMATLFHCSVDNVSLHLKNIFKSGELDENSVYEEFSVTARDGKNYDTKHYNLDAIIAIGYRVNSIKATQFRRWATGILKNYLVAGYSINKNRLENDEQAREKLIKELQEMRYRNQTQYRQKVLDSISKICFDYEEYKKRDSRKLGQIFATIQDMFHIASSGKTSAQLVLENADSTKPMAGMVSFRGTEEEISADNLKIGRNYMDEKAYRKMDVAIESFYLFLESRLLNEQKIFVSELEYQLQTLIKSLGFNPFAGYIKPLREKADQKAKIVAKEFRENHKLLKQKPSSKKSKNS